MNVPPVDSDPPLIPPEEIDQTPQQEEVKEISSTSVFHVELKAIIATGGSKEIYISELKKAFGSTLIDRIIGTGLTKKWPENLERKHCIEFLGAIGHQVTLDDLEEAFAQIKSGKITWTILHQVQMPTLRLWWNTNFQGLPTYWKNQILTLFRNGTQVLLPETELPLGAELYRTGTHRYGNVAYTHYDHLVRQLAKKGDRSRAEFFLASRELIAKRIAYTRPENVHDGALVPIFREEKGKLVYYKVAGQVHMKGFHAYLFTPLVSDPKDPAILVYRGTQGAASVQRDLDPTGVGKSSFLKMAPQVRAMLEKTNSEKLEVIGHSLGAADASRTVAFLLDPTAKCPFKQISLYAYCAPKLDIATIEEWRRHLKIAQLLEKRPTIELNFAEHEKDFVTWTGSSNLTGEESTFVHTNYLIVSSKSGSAKNHHTRPFFKEGNFDFETDKRTFRLLQSFPHGELAKHIAELERIKTTHPWLLTLKGLFFTQPSQEELEARIAEMEKARSQVQSIENGQSWMVWSAGRAADYTVRAFGYYTFRGIRAITGG
ncbi:hypothetical protein [Candidatus Neptunochlamydia vexilliferae]|uniref:Fungal lipase-like domain-containing protein n=1 Tax=Candidatus Neptunichlamydia vexilliferae TaxID=1651774 RepID=A0ABS0AXC3_9BACT|nr:hypothetical protein [Candidatus Neptunochlamydia vexilliferae]MBF5058620.1 hypothetical protein [Candidatus Neptunochlamydia vexilliferae]